MEFIYKMGGREAIIKRRRSMLIFWYITKQFIGFHGDKIAHLNQRSSYIKERTQIWSKSFFSHLNLKLVWFAGQIKYEIEKTKCHV